MGFSGTYRYDGTRWHELEGWSQAEHPGRWLAVVIFDSDLAEVRYQPAGPGTGSAFLGYTPRDYFGDEDASAPTDVPREAAGLAAWWADGDDAADTDGKAGEIEGFLAADDAPHVHPKTDDADLFVEIKAARFLTALGLPLPPALAR
ncbi:hypothetical protein V5P93_003713 [Actinokineospora auranticolor]|uniref:Uncharacterized protein n=1 Tax=Actinokineospora auranticolor TaxID=155976 RepID=A0A2S6GJ85_9PSEU|nr:hypothetical protein [Actinokineospora auranticolor]PPK65275.1 hypothetical protein CLV40_115122 [Actinokineospora auranticolor]